MEGLGLGVDAASIIPLDTLLDFSSSDFAQLTAPPDSDSLVLQHGDEEEEEEELEWISNQDAFPSIETTFDMNHQSPVSVLSATTTTTTLSNNSFGFPIQAKRSKRKRRSTKGCWGLSQPNRVLITTTSSSIEIGVRKCSHCSVEKTPQWRAGPLGPKTLCNACGVRYKSGRLVPEYRPASSPSFSSELHSNSHRRILEMRKKHKGSVHFTLKRN